MHSTPIKSSKVTNQTDQDAKSKHLAESERIKDILKEDPRYLEHMFGSSYERARHDLWVVINHSAVLIAFQRLADAPKDKLQRRVTDLLNIISFVHYKTHLCPNGTCVQPGPRAVVFADKDRNLVQDDWNSARMQPDFTASATDEKTLRSVVQNRNTVPLASFNTLIGVGEKVSSGKSDTVAKGQMSHYITSTRMYQPQLLVVHGFRLSNSVFTLWSHNPCGICTSATYPTIEDNDEKKKVNETREFALENRPQALVGYIMHVLLLYNSLETSIPRIWYNSAGYWEVYGMKILPFYAARAPGRGSWVGFEVEIIGKKLVIVGVVKIYWPDVDAKFDERETLDSIHSDGDIPGVVLREPLEEEIHEVIIGMEGGKIHRKLRIIRMASWGNHLPACKSVLDLLKVGYDAILAHWRIWNRDVLHRDISWGNVLCKPSHRRDLNVAQQDPFYRPCIEQVLGNAKGQSCALLADFDHAANNNILKALGYTGRKERTGTPMYISMELASKIPLTRRIDIIVDLRALEKRIVGSETHCGQAFRQAFPDNSRNIAFLRQFTKVADDEREKHAEEDFSSTTVNPKHRPDHDIESFYWVFLWAFARVRPKGSDPFPTSCGPYDTFCQAMIAHVPGEHDKRGSYLFRPDLRNLFHPQLTRVARIFECMACYLSMRWSDYDDIFPDHAHMAFLRLLLMEIIDIQNNRAPNVEFEDSPRSFHISGVIKASLLTQSASSTNHKRKMDEEEEEGKSNSKKPRLQTPETEQPEQLDPAMTQVLRILAEAGWFSQPVGTDPPSTELDDINTDEAFAACQQMTGGMKLYLGANKQ